MRATLLNFTVLHADDLIGILDRAQPVSHDNDCLLATVDEVIESLLNLVL